MDNLTQKLNKDEENTQDQALDFQDKEDEVIVEEKITRKRSLDVDAKIYKQEFQTYDFTLSKTNNMVSLKGVKWGDSFYVEVSSGDVARQTNLCIKNCSDLYIFLQNGLGMKHKSASLEVRCGEKRQANICDRCRAFNIR
jgi:hypothetical protein